MCIIAAKPAGVAMPTEEEIRTMWENNPHGAGFMYPDQVTRKGKRSTVVRIEKGFMTLEALTHRLEALAKERDLTATALVLHFRITTHGGTCPENCHPFPLTGSVGVLRKLRTTAPVGIAHNGIIPSVSPRRGISDTMEYIASQLYPLYQALPRFYDSKPALQLVENAIQSKLAILTPDGTIRTVGKFHQHEGVLYSNDSYIPDDFSAWCDGKRFGFADISVASLPLMYLDDVPGSFAQTPDGELLEGDDLALDEHGRVYWYDPEMGAWEPTDFTAFSPSGAHLRFDPDLAFPDYVLTD